MQRTLVAMLCVVVVVLAVLASQRGAVQQHNGVAIEPLTAIGAVHPRISPDGSAVVFSYQGAIWTMPRTGGTMTRLTDGPGLDIEPAWSHDGKRIAFVRSPNMNGGDLHLIDAADGKPVALPKPVQVRGTSHFYKGHLTRSGKRLV